MDIEHLLQRIGELQFEISCLNEQSSQYNQLWIGCQSLLDYSYGEINKLRAENARLQAMIDEANAQEPAFIWNRGLIGTESEKSTPLYAAPIPAKQSPAVAVPDEVLVKRIRDIWFKSQCSHVMRKHVALEIINTVRDSIPRITEKDAIGISEKCKMCNGHGLIGGFNGDGYDSDLCPECNPVIRVTENDAREIARDILSFCNIDPLSKVAEDSWMVFYGRKLIEKLNK